MTPHHRECFDFVGSCAIYACGSTDYETIDLAGRADVEVLSTLSERLSVMLTAPDGAAGGRGAAPTKGRAGDVGDLLRYKRALLRELNAAIAKAGREPPVRPQLEGTSEVETAAATTFIADDLVIGDDPRRRDRIRKAALVRRMAAVEVPRDPGLLGRVRALVARIISWLRP